MPPLLPIKLTIAPTLLSEQHAEDSGATGYQVAGGRVVTQLAGQCIEQATVMLVGKKHVEEGVRTGIVGGFLHDTGQQSW